MWEYGNMRSKQTVDRILAFLSDNQPCTAKEIAKGIDERGYYITPANVGQILHPLYCRGEIQRERIAGGIYRYSMKGRRTQ